MFSVYSHEITIFLLMAFILFPNTIHTHTYTHTGNTYIHTHTLSCSLRCITHIQIYQSANPSTPFMFATCTGLTQGQSSQQPFTALTHCLQAETTDVSTVF